MFLFKDELFLSFFLVNHPHHVIVAEFAAGSVQLLPGLLTQPGNTTRLFILVKSFKFAYYQKLAFYNA